MQLFYFTGPVTNMCYDVVDQKCKNNLHYSKTIIPTSLQKAEDTIFKVVIDSNCSKELEKFICYTQFPPCYPNRPSVTYIPCKSLCDTINKKCWKQFVDYGLPLPHCDYVYPRDDNATGLCEVKQWPALWPKKFRPSPPRKCGTCSILGSVGRYFVTPFFLVSAELACGMAPIFQFACS